MREIRHPSCAPYYITAAVWILYVLIFPLRSLGSFITLAVIAAAVFIVSRRLFPGTVEQVELPPEPETTGNAELDELLRQGADAIGEMRRIRKTVDGTSAAPKIDELISVTERIFADAREDANDIPQIKRFAAYFLPTTVKLLTGYEKMYLQQLDTENIRSTMQRIDGVLDSAVASYKKQLDALFANEALDLDTDITVMEGMLKREGLAGSDFNINNEKG